MAELYSHVPGASPGTGQLEGYYQYGMLDICISIPRSFDPHQSAECAQAPTVSLTFGGHQYSINIADFSLVADEAGVTCVGGPFFLSSTMKRKSERICLAFFAIDVGSGSGVSWVVGDAFLVSSSISLPLLA